MLMSQRRRSLEVLVQDSQFSPGHWLSGNMFCCYTMGGGVPGRLPTMHRLPPTTNYLAPSFHHAEAEKSWSGLGN